MHETSEGFMSIALNRTFVLGEKSVTDTSDDLRVELEKNILAGHYVLSSIDDNTSHLLKRGWMMILYCKLFQIRQ